MRKPETREIHGINLTVIPTDQFKMTTIGVQFVVPMEEERVAERALLPYVLMRGSERYPSADAIQKELARLYGASLGFGAGKKGSVQLPSFTLKVVNEKFLGGGEDVFGQSVSLLCDVLFHPNLKNGVFPEEELAKEKEQQRKRIESIFDDKIAYASERCLEEMGKGYRFSLPRLGRVSDLDRLTAKSLTDAYHEMVNNYALHIMIVGDVDPSSVFQTWEKLLPMTRNADASLPDLERFTREGDKREVIERQEINQGKLNIGYRTSTTFEEAEYPALVLYNAVLGGTPTSKLFVNVREKASLCYYVSSRLEPFSGILFIQSGIEVDNFDKAKQIIDQQLADLANGKITDEEMQFSRQSLINQFKTAHDSPDSVIDLNLSSKLTGHTRTLESLIEDINKVTRDDVQSIAKRIVEDTVYFLRN